MQVKLIADTPVLVPNPEHKNFTANGRVLPKDTILEGNPQIIEGLRRGSPFKYRVFCISQNEFVHINKTIPTMSTKTQVFLGADAQQSPTVVDVPTNNMTTPVNLMGAALGAYLMHRYAKKHGKKNAAVYVIAGAAGGFVVTRFVAGRLPILVKKSK